MKHLSKMIKIMLGIGILLPSMQPIYANTPAEYAVQIVKPGALDEYGGYSQGTEILTNTNNIQPGDVLQVDVLLNIQESHRATSLQYELGFDNNLVEVLVDEYGEYHLPFDASGSPFSKFVNEGRPPTPTVQHKMTDNFHQNYTTFTFSGANGVVELEIPNEDNRLKSYYFVVKENVEPGSEISFFLRDRSSNGGPLPVIGDINQKNVPFELRNAGRASVTVKSEDVELPEVKVENIQVNGDVEGTSYNYFDGKFKEGTSDYRNDTIIVPQSVETLSFDFDVLNANDLKVQTYKANENGANFGSDLSLHSGINYFKAVIRDGETILDEYDFKVHRLSNSLEFNFIAQSNNEILLPEKDNQFAFNHNVTSLSLSATSKDEVYTYQGIEYKYKSEMSISLTNIVDTSNLELNEFKTIMKIIPEDALSIYTNVPGNNPKVMVKDIEYTFRRMSNDTSISNVKLTDNINSDFSDPIVNGTSYTFNVDSNIETVSLNFDVAPNATVTTDPVQLENIVLSSLSTQVEITVIAEDLTETIYFVNINKAARDTNDLSHFIVKVNNNQTPQINETYTGSDTNVVLDDLVFSNSYYIEISPFLLDDGSYVSSDSIKNIKLNTGLNEFEIIVNSESGKSKTYSISVTVLENDDVTLTEDDIKVNIPEDDLVNPGSPIEKGLSDEENHIYEYDISVKYHKKTFDQDDITLTLPHGAIATYGESIDLVVNTPQQYLVTVVSQNGLSTAKYIFNVTRYQNSEVAIEFNVLNPTNVNISGSGLKWNVIVDPDISEYELSVTALDDSTILEGGSGVYALESSNHTHIIKVQSQDKSHVVEYIITFNREKSNDATLKHLYISHNQLEKTDYLSSFVNNVLTLSNVDSDKITFEAIAKQQGVSIEIYNNTKPSELKNEFDLIHDSTNVFTVKLTTELDQTEVYQVRVNRAKSTDATLSGITYTDSQNNSNEVPGINSIEEYTIIDEYTELTTYLNLTLTKNDEKSKVVIYNNSVLVTSIANNIKSQQVLIPLTSGNNTITIEVIAHDGVTKKTYTMYATKELSSNTNLGNNGEIDGSGTTNAPIKHPNDPYKYSVYVNYGVTSYGKDDFVLHLNENQSVEYTVDTIELDLSKTGQNPNGVFTFDIIAENEDRQQYEISVFIMVGQNPLLNGITINGKEVVGFKANEFKQTIQLDEYLSDDRQFVSFMAIGDNTKYQTIPVSKVIDTKGHSSSLHSVTLKGNNGFDTVYEFTLIKSLSSNNNYTNIVFKDKQGNPLLDSNGNEIILDETYDFNEAIVLGELSEIIIEAQLEDLTGTIRGTGLTTLIPGRNIVIIVFEAEDGSESTHELIIDTPIELDELTLDNRNLLDPEVARKTVVNNFEHYEVILPFDAESIDVDLLIQAHPSIIIDKSFGTKVRLQNEGNIEFKYESTLGVKKTVTISYTRFTSSDAKLTSLGLNGVSIPIIDNQYSYDINVGARLLQVNFEDLEYETSHPFAIVTGSGHLDIEQGKVNSYHLIVTAEDGTIVPYTVNIIRGSYNFLESLSIEAGKGYLYENFDKDRLNYDALIFANHLEFSFVWDVEEGVKVINESELKNIKLDSFVSSDVFEIKVQDGNHPDIKTYKVRVNKGLSTRLTGLSVSEGLLDFNPDNQRYMIKVNETINTVDLYDFITEDINATIYIDNNEVNDRYQLILTNTSTQVEVMVNNGTAAQVYIFTFEKVKDQTSISKVIVNSDNNYWESTHSETGELSILIGSETMIETLDFNVVLETPGGLFEVSSPTFDEEDNAYHYTITVTDSNGIIVDYPLVIKNDLSDNNYLESLSVNNSPVFGFNKFHQDYSYQINYDELFTIQAIAEKSSATVSISDYDPQTVEDNDVIRIFVTSEKGSIREYKLVVLKTQENKAVLTSLNLEEARISPIFNPLNAKYYVNVPHEMDSVTVRYSATEGIDVLINDTLNEEVELVNGENIIEVTVSTENGSTFTYIITVYRNEPADNYLDSLVISHNDGIFEFDKPFNKDILDYTIWIPQNLDTIKVDATSLTGDVFGVGDIELNNNPISLHKVHVDKFGVRRTYTITIVRQPSSEARIEELQIDDKLMELLDGNMYYLEVDTDVTTVELNVVHNEGSRSEYEQHPQLVAGRNIVSVSVIAEDQITRETYTVVIYKQPKLESIIINDEEYTISRIEGQQNYKIDTVLPSNITASHMNAIFNDASIQTKGLEAEIIFNSSGTVNFEMITLDADVYPVSVEYTRELSSNADLERININGEILNFTDGQYDDYRIKVPFNFEQLESSIHVSVEAHHPNTEITLPETMTLITGDNIFTINTLSENGLVDRVYTIIIERSHYEAGASTLLASLTIDNVKVDFVPENLVYKVKVLEDWNELVFNDIIPQDINASVFGSFPIVNNTMVVDLTLSMNPKITLTNDGKVSIYDIKIEKVSSQTDIKTIKVDDNSTIWDAKFDNSKNKYIALVDYDTDMNQININTELEFTNSTKMMSEPRINADGNVEYTIIVTDENNFQNEHILEIIKDKNNDASITDIIVKGERIPNFHPSNFNYVINTTMDEIYVAEDIVALLTDPNASYTVEINNSIIEVKVSADNGQESTYVLELIFDNPGNVTLNTLGLLEVGMNPKFISTQSKYYVTVPNDMDFVTLYYDVDPNVDVEVKVDQISYDEDTNVISNLSVGRNTILVQVSYEGFSYTYTIIVERNNASTSNYLEDLYIVDAISNDNILLRPGFDKELMIYNVIVPFDANTFIVNAEYSENSMVSGLGEIVINSYPYHHTVRVADRDGVVREYSILFTQEASNETSLDNLSVSDGQLSPAFSKDTLSYTVDVSNDITDIEITYLSGHEDQMVSGAGIKILEVGMNTFEIEVVSGSESRKYSIHVNRRMQAPLLDNLMTDIGDFEETFNDGLFLYHINVDETIEEIELITHSKYTVVGDGFKQLELGENIFEITVSNNGLSTRYYALVSRGQKPENSDQFYLENVDLAYLSIVDEELNEVFDSNKTAYSVTLKNAMYDSLQINAIARNPYATVTIEGQNSIQNGSNEIIITVKLENGISKTTIITAELKTDFIRSQEHTIGNEYIMTIVENQSVLDVKNQMDNDNSYLLIMFDGEALDDHAIVSSGAIIKLVMDNKEYDSKQLVIRGDVNGDGVVNIPDRMQAQSYILGGNLTQVQLLAADVTQDNLVQINDVMLIQAHILKLQSIFSMEER